MAIGKFTGTAFKFGFIPFHFNLQFFIFQVHDLLFGLQFFIFEFTLCPFQFFLLILFQDFLFPIDVFTIRRMM
jgi:hypothetical protein